ncbi:MAG TPA: cell division protein ZapA [Candidatus Krumholzibacteria bacterium]|nr:cell division protein ZapA [Candidatus Krumholzibacteria bacterium]
MEPGTTTVHIYGQRYTVRSDDDPEHVERVAAYLDSRMREVARASSQVTSLRVAILAALNITDELFRERESRSEGSDEIHERARRLASELERTIGDAESAPEDESTAADGGSGAADPHSERGDA